MQLSVREVDKKIFIDFKAKAVKTGITIGDALTLAMKHWLDEEEERKSFLELKPIDWGKGTEKTSTEIDTIIYGK